MPAPGDNKPTDARVGTMLGGKYRLLRLLGAGGMGSVYEAENTWMNRRVAIKTMHGAMGTNPDLVARFQREAKAATRVSHPNIVDVLDIGQEPTDGSFYIVQEFLTGEDLAAILGKKGKISAREALEIMVPIMSALVAVHAAGILHRDLKPDNIFVVRDPTQPASTCPKLIDFGISKLLEEGPESLTLTRTGTTVGTPFYMSPEQARGAKNIDQQADIWAMGAVFYEALSGRPPFVEDNYNALLAEILTPELKRVEYFAPETPTELADVIHQALERDRAMRFVTMEQLLEATLACPGLMKEAWYRRLVAIHRPSHRESERPPPMSDSPEDSGSFARPTFPDASDLLTTGVLPADPTIPVFTATTTPLAPAIPPAPSTGFPAPSPGDPFYAVTAPGAVHRGPFPHAMNSTSLAWGSQPIAPPRSNRRFSGGEIAGIALGFAALAMGAFATAVAVARRSERVVVRSIVRPALSNATERLIPILQPPAPTIPTLPDSNALNDNAEPDAGTIASSPHAEHHAHRNNAGGEHHVR